MNPPIPKNLKKRFQALIRGELSDHLLEIVLKSTPLFFEKLVVELLVKMGYGGSHREAGRAFGQSSDEGLMASSMKTSWIESIYIQAKRWKKDNSIGRSEICVRFAGKVSQKRGVHYYV